MIFFARTGLGHADLHKVPIVPVLRPNVPDVFFFDRDDSCSIIVTVVLYTDILIRLKTLDGPSVGLFVELPLRSIRNAVIGTKIPITDPLI